MKYACRQTISEKVILIKSKRKILFAGICAILFVLLVFLIRMVDVAATGPEGTNIGLSHLNKAVFDMFGVNMLWCTITGWIGVTALFVVFLFAFPSSNTMMVCTIMGSTMMLLNKYIGMTGLRKFLFVICGLAIAVTVMGRLISGVYWFTDIVGGVLVSTTLLSLFSWVVERFKDELELAEKVYFLLGP